MDALKAERQVAGQERNSMQEQLQEMRTALDSMQVQTKEQKITTLQVSVA